MVLNRIKCNQHYHIWQKTPTWYNRLYYESFPSQPTFNFMKGLYTFTEQKWVHSNTSEETTKMKSKNKLAVANSDHYFCLQTGRGWMLTSIWNRIVKQDSKFLQHCVWGTFISLYDVASLDIWLQTIWHHCSVSKRQEPNNRWFSTTSKKNGLLNCTAVKILKTHLHEISWDV